MTPITERLAELLRTLRDCDLGDAFLREIDVALADYEASRTHPAECGEGRDYVLVPREPTEAMVSAGFDVHPCRTGETKVTDAYKAMLAAAPLPQPVAPERGEAKAVAHDDLREAAEDVLDRFHWMLSPDAKGNHTVKDLSVKAVLRLCEKILATPQPPLAPSELDVEAMLRECVPGGSMCDPQRVCDNIREWFAGQPSALRYRDPAPSAPDALTADFHVLRERIDLRFRSGNNISVERASLTIDEWMRLRSLATQGNRPSALRYRDPTIEDADAALEVFRNALYHTPRGMLAALNAIGAKVET